MAKSIRAPRKKAAPPTKPPTVSKAVVPKRAVVTVDALRPASKRKGEGADSGPRRTIFIDVENTSGEAALIAALDQLEIDRTTMPTELVAVGNWRVIGQHVARMLAQRGARLLHTAPATGVKDWSDLSIAVAAGIWLGRARAGDQVEIVSADRAFDAVADAAAHLGVKFRRLTYGSVSGLAEAIAVDPALAATGGRRRSRRGGRSRRGRGMGAPAWSSGGSTSSATLPAADLPTPVAASSGATPPRTEAASIPSSHPVEAAHVTNGEATDIHGASHEQIVRTIARLTARAPERGVNLDLLINALKEEGFGRPPGSPRLVTRLRKMKDVIVSPTGMVRLAPGTIVVPTELPVSPPPASPKQEQPAGPAAETAGEKRPARRPRHKSTRSRRKPAAGATAKENSGADEAAAES